MSPISLSLGDALSLIRPIGMPPIGSPSLVREHAAHLRRSADDLDAASVLLRSCAHVDGYLGPAARRHESETGHEAHMLQQRVHQLRDLAARLDSAAAGLERSQTAWRSSFSNAARMLPGGLAERALAHLGWRKP